MVYTEQLQKGTAILARRAKKNPIELMVSIRQADPSADKARVIARFVREVRADDKYDDATVEYAAHIIWNNLNATSTQRKPRRIDRVRQQAKELAEAAKRAQSVRKMILLEWIMPNNKPFGDCYAFELAQWGSRFTTIAKKIGDKRVRDVLSEKAVQEMFK